MNLSYGESFYAYDTLGMEFSTDSRGITKDGDEYRFDWDAQPTVTVDANDLPASYREFFDTDTFYRLPATVAKSIEQEYVIDGDTYTFFKPEDELRQAAWSLDNSPYTLKHPGSGRVQSTDEIKGFWKNRGYDDGLQADLYIPTNDSEVTDFIADNQDVSVGFTNVLSESDRDGVVADQRHIYFDHVAGVTDGRCGPDEGCGLCDFDPDSPPVEAAMTPTTGVDATVDDSDDGDGGDGDDDDADSQSMTTTFHTDRYEKNGTTYLLSPDESGTEGPGYPVDNCSDVQDAWGLRNHGQYSDDIDLEGRIKRRARELNCSVPSTDAADGGFTVTDSTHEFYTTMSNDKPQITLQMADASVDKIRDESESVDALLTDKEQKVETLQEQVSDLQDAQDRLSDVREALDADEDADPSEVAEWLHDSYDDLQDRLNDYRQDDIDELKEEITEVADYEDGELARPDDRSIPEHIEWLQDKKETLAKVKGDVSVTNANDGTDVGGGTDTGGGDGESEFDRRRDGSVDLMSQMQAGSAF